MRAEWSVVNDSPDLPVALTAWELPGQQGVAVQLDVEASDADGDTLNFSAAGMPPGLQIDAATGSIGGTTVG